MEQHENAANLVGSLIMIKILVTMLMTAEMLPFKTNATEFPSILATHRAHPLTATMLLYLQLYLLLPPQEPIKPL